MTKQFLYARHLDTALTIDKLEFYQNHPQLWDDRYPAIPSSFISVPKNGFIRGINLFNWIHRLVTQQGDRNIAKSTQLWNVLKRNASTSLDLQLQGMYRDFPLVQLGGFGVRKDLACAYTNLQGAFHRKYMISQIHYSLSSLSMRGEYPFLLPQCPQIEFYYDMVILRSFPECPVVIPYSYLLGVFDRIEAEFAYNMYVSLKATSPMTSGLEYFTLTDRVDSTLWRIHKTLGVESSRVCKLLEPICLGVCLEILDPACNDTNFMTELLEELRESKPRIYPYAMNVVSILRDYLVIHEDRGVPVVLEQYGHEKRFFYPIVNEDAGLLKMYKYGTEVRQVDRGYVNEVKGLAVIDYIVAFFNKYGHLPPIVQDPTLDLRIIQILQSGTPQSIDHCRSIPLSAWSVVTFEKHRDFNYYEDITDLLDDKAITPHRDNWRQLFAYDALRCVGSLKKKSREDTKLILAILNSEEINIKDFYEAVEKIGGLPNNWTLIQAMAKERELKIEARMFSILILEVRMMCSAAERNIKEGLFPLLPQQSITMSGPELKQVLDTMVTRQLSEEHVWVVFNLDLEQWNYTFRFPVQHPFTSMLGQIFGVRHFTSVLSVFLDSTIVSSRKFSPPGTPGKVTHWDVHTGGNQGIFQALWSWITIEIEREVLLRHPYKFLEIGSGDNRVLLVQFPKSQGLHNNILQLREDLRTAFSRAGLALKVEETWFSSDILAYQRKYWFRGQQVENGIKQVNRAYAGGADVALGVDELITTAMNGGLTIAEVTTDPFIGPLFAYMEGLGAICCHPQFSSSELIKGDRLSLLPLFNTDFGYYPFMQLSGFLSAGHPDALTDSLALIKRIWEVNPQLHAALATFLNWTRDPNRREAFENLVLSPSSLYLRKPAPMTAHLKQAVQELLFKPGMVRNKKIRSLLSAVEKLNRSQFINSLQAITPINSSLLNTLLETSYVGQVEAMVNHFNRVGSLVHVTQMNRMDAGAESFQNLIDRLDTNFMRYLSKRLQCARPVYPDFVRTLMGGTWASYLDFCTVNNLVADCSFSCRLFLTSYTHYLSPLMILGPYSPSAIEQTVPYREFDPALLDHSVVVTPSHNIPPEATAVAGTRGPFKPLLGSSTSNPARTIRLSSLQGLDVSKAIRELLKIYSWFVGMQASPSLLEYIKAQLDAKAPGISKVAEVLVSGTRGGTFEHRFAMLGQVMGAFSNNPSAVSTWYQLSTNEAKLLQRGSEDRFVFFQVIFQHLMSGLRFCNPVNIRWYAAINIEHCGTVIPPQKFSTSGSSNLSAAVDPHVTSLAPSLAGKLLAETHHLLLIAGLPRTAVSLGEESISAVVSHQFSRALKQYQLGGARSMTRYQTGSAPQSEYNVTLLRMVGLPALLTSLALHLFHHHVWTTSSSLVKYKHVVMAMTLRSSSIQDCQPYMPLIEAIVTAGHLPELIRLTQAPCKWAVGSLHTQLVSIFLKGIVYGICQLASRRVKSVLLVEAQSQNYNWEFLWRTLSSLHRPFKEFVSKYPKAGPQLGFSKYYQTNPVVSCWCTSDYKLVEEQLRGSWQTYVTAQQAQAYDLPQSPHLFPKFPPGLDNIRVSGSQAPTPSSPPVTQEKFLHLLSASARTNSRILYSVGRWGGVSSSARLKLMKIIPTIPLLYGVQYNHISLAEGAGSYASMLLHWRIQDTLICNSLLAPEDLPHCFSTNFIPYECLCACRVDKRIVNKQVQHLYSGDLTNEGTWKEVMLAHIQTKSPCGIITFDMEGYGVKKSSIIANLVQMVLALQPVGVIIKLFVEDLTSPNLKTLAQLCSRYTSVHLIKPDASNIWSSELFLVVHSLSLSSPVDLSLASTIFLGQWTLKLSEALPVTVWAQALQLAGWWNTLSICPMTRPSTLSWIEPYHHPMTEILTNIAHSLCWLASSVLQLGLMLPRGTSHMFVSKSRGTRATCGFLNSILLSVGLVLNWCGFKGDTIDHNSVLDVMSTRSDDDIRLLLRIIHTISFPGDQVLLLKALGEVVSDSRSINGPEVRGLLGVIHTIASILPSNWGLTQSLKQQLVLLESISPLLVFPVGSLARTVIVNCEVRDQLRGLATLACDKLKVSPSRVLTVPAVLAASLLVAGVVEVITHNPQSEVRITDRGATNVVILDPEVTKFHIQWGVKQSFSSEELSSCKILHTVTLEEVEYVLGLWWSK